jgi:hypothetical protein
MFMKSVKMVQVLCIVMCLLGYKLASGQSDYVVTVQGDTISGKVKYLNYGVEKKVQVILPDSKKEVYTILQTKGFFMDDEIYQTIRTLQGYTYMKLLKKGYLSLYAYQMANQVTWDGRYLMKKDGSGLDVPNIGFKKQVAKYLSDCPTVVGGIESGELTRTKVDEIIDTYNACIASNSSTKNLNATNTATTKLDTWNTLETDVTNLTDFEGKSDALEMIHEIKGKVKVGDKVPNFLKEGLKDALKNQSTVQETLTKALQEVQ